MNAPSKPVLNWTISLGNIIQIAVIVVGLAIGWATFDARSKSNGESTRANREAIAAQDARLRALEQNFARTEERLSSILTLVTRIDDRLERFEGTKP